MEAPSRILVVDDEAPFLEMMSDLLASPQFHVDSCSDPGTVLSRLAGEPFDVVVSDVNMPGKSGLDLLEDIRVSFPDIPVILMSGCAVLDITVEAIHKGTFDFLVKPFNPVQLVHSISKACDYRKLALIKRDYTRNLEETVRQRTREVNEASREMILRLMVAAEYRDDETGNHIRRIGLYARHLAELLGMPDDFIEAITFASAMHDIGKIGIPDSILLKPGNFTRAEFDLMKEHTVIGNKILAGSNYSHIRMAASIALHHHERWDGSGYPNGLRGGEIPIEGRIVMLADQYEALRSERPYKPAFNHDTVVNIILEGDGRTQPEHFDPHVLKAFAGNTGKFRDIFSRSF